MLIRPPAARLPRNRLSRRGFSFTEILFAVMILGIGFIMVVAIFPVALQQTENSQAETVGAAIARAGVSFVSQNASTTYFDQLSTTSTTPPPPASGFSILRPTFTGPIPYNLYKSLTTGGPIVFQAAPAASFPELVGEVWSFDHDADPTLQKLVSYVNKFPLSTNQTWFNVAWPLMAQSMIHTADPRYAWVAFYRRNLVQTSPSSAVPLQYTFATNAQLIVIALKAQGKQFYDQSDLLLQPEAPPYYPTSIQPSRGRATITAPGNNSLNLNFTIQFIDPVLQARAAEGAFVIIATDRLPTNDGQAGFLNGHIYKLGIPVTGTTDTWEFAPGYAPPLPTGAVKPLDYLFLQRVSTFQVYMVGKAIDPNDTAKPPTHYAGQAQDIAAYSTFISCPSN